MVATPSGQRHRELRATARHGRARHGWRHRKRPIPLPGRSRLQIPRQRSRQGPSGCGAPSWRPARPRGGVRYLAPVRPVGRQAHDLRRVTDTVQRKAAVRSPLHHRVLRYGALSVITFVGGEALLALFFGVFRWSAVQSNLTAVAIGTGPTYWMSRRWVWQRSGRSHLVKEVLPFWLFMFLSVGASTALGAAAESVAPPVASSHAGEPV